MSLSQILHLFSITAYRTVCDLADTFALRLDNGLKFYWSKLNESLEDCAKVSLEFGRYKITDVPCTGLHKFVCEKD